MFLDACFDNFWGSGFQGLEEEYSNLENRWMALYDNDNIASFSLIFKTDNSEVNIPVSYVYRMYNFLGNLKKLREENPVKYGKLKQSIIIVKSGNLRFLLKMLFSLIAPFANVYIVSNDETCEEVKLKIMRNIPVIVDPSNDNIAFIKAGKSWF